MKTAVEVREMIELETLRMESIEERIKNKKNVEQNEILLKEVRELIELETLRLEYLEERNEK